MTNASFSILTAIPFEKNCFTTLATGWDPDERSGVARIYLSPPDNSAREELGALFDYSVNRVRGESTLGK